MGLWEPSSFIFGLQQGPAVSEQVIINASSSLLDEDGMGWDVIAAVRVMHLLQDAAWYLNNNTNGYGSGTECCSPVSEIC